MDWSEYKNLCDQPDYWSHWMLSQCLQLIAHPESPDLVAAMQQALASQPLDRPQDHKGPQSTFMYHFPLSLKLSEILLRQIQDAQNSRKNNTDTQTRGLGGFVAACQELLDHARAEAIAKKKVETAAHV